MHSHECGDPADPAQHYTSITVRLLVEGADLAQMVPDEGEVEVAALAMANRPGRDGAAVADLLTAALSTACEAEPAHAYVLLRAAALVARSTLITNLEGPRP